MKLKIKKREEPKEDSSTAPLSKIERAMEVSRPPKYKLVRGHYSEAEKEGSCDCCSQPNRYVFILQFLRLVNEKTPAFSGIEVKLCARHVKELIDILPKFPRDN